MTHWLAPFTYRDRWGQQRAACGEYIDPTLHHTEPTCPDCAAYLAREHTLDAELDATFAEPFDPAMEVRHVDFDPTTGQQFVSNRRDPRR